MQIKKERKKEVLMWFKGQAAYLCASGIQKLVPRLNKCLDSAGESYIKAIHSQCCFCKLNKLYMVKTFVSLLSGRASYNLCPFHPDSLSSILILAF
jgi:hypothetical protein